MGYYEKQQQRESLYLNWKVVKCCRLSVIFFLLLLSYVCQLQAQVTVGSQERAIDGALLQIKESESNDVNSQKGILLPRVELTRIQGLRPMLGAWDGNDYEKSRHIGLTVYNVNRCLPGGFGRGVYTWDGIQWQYLGAREDITTYYSYRDQEGNPFTAASFGEAGIWMTQNVGVKIYADGTPVDPDGPSLQDDNENPRWAYPGSTGANDGVTPTDFRRDSLTYGLLYNWRAATRNQNKPEDFYENNIAEGVFRDQCQRNSPEPDKAEVEGFLETADGLRDGKVQGICPDGWHVPSDREWNQLEKVIYENPGKYSNFKEKELQKFSTDPWNPNWEWGRNDSEAPTYNNASSGKYRGPSVKADGSLSGLWSGEENDPGLYGHGAVLKAPCPPQASYTISNNVNGESKSNYFGGFNVLLTGYRIIGGDVVRDYGWLSYFWTSSANMYGQSYNAMARLLHSWHAAVFRADNEQARYYAVRCKKDDNKP